MGKKPYRNEYGTDKPIVIKEMTLEQIQTFVEHRATCTDRICGECACDPHNFVRPDQDSCGVLFKDVTQRFKELLEKQGYTRKESLPPKQDKKACVYCDHYNTHLGDDGYSFCMCWHNFTQRDGYCHNFACKSVPEAVI